MPGHLIGRADRFYQVVRCLSCIFFGPYYTYFIDNQPVRVEYDPADAQFQWSQGDGDGLRDMQASIDWQPGEFDLDPEPSGLETFAGGSPVWIAEDQTPNCPSCQGRMEFVLQHSSATLDTISHNEQMRDQFFMDIEYYATLYFFACEGCSVTCSITQCP